MPCLDVRHTLLLSLADLFSCDSGISKQRKIDLTCDYYEIIEIRGGQFSYIMDICIFIDMISVQCILQCYKLCILLRTEICWIGLGHKK